MKTRKVKLGYVGVDSGQLVICDPAYIESQYKKHKYSDLSGHTIYKHTDGSLWQFVYGEKSMIKDVNPFPSTYGQIIPKYGKTPNEMIESGEFMESGIDPYSAIPKGEFSYDGICSVTLSKQLGGQINYEMGHGGCAVAFSTGGDGTFDVWAEITEDNGNEFITKIWINL